jgi:hypothetical protein
MNYERDYIGTGKQVATTNMIKATIPVDNINEHIYEYEGRKYLTVTIGPKKNGADQFGKTHNVWVDVLIPDGETPILESEVVEEMVQTPPVDTATPKKTTRKRKTTAKAKK